MSQGYTPSMGEDPDRFLGSCRGKVKHPSKKRASASVRRLLATGDVYAPEFMGVYKCKACGRWHLGHDFRRQEPAND